MPVSFLGPFPIWSLSRPWSGWTWMTRLFCVPDLPLSLPFLTRLSDYLQGQIWSGSGTSPSSYTHMWPQANHVVLLGLGLILPSWTLSSYWFQGSPLTESVGTLFRASCLQEHLVAGLISFTCFSGQTASGFLVPSHFCWHCVLFSQTASLSSHPVSTFFCLYVLLSVVGCISFRTTWSSRRSLLEFSIQYLAVCLHY